jgi:hypothetical protein
MFRQRQLYHLFVGCILAFALASGTALPSPWLWQCRYATRVIASPSSVTSAEMPCHMSGRMMMSGTMPCCRPHVSTSQKSQNTPKDTSPNCNPVFIPTASLPAAQMHATDLHLSQHITPVFTSYAANVSAPFQVALTTPQQKRPPPNFNSSSLTCLNTLRPRAPPMA